MPLPYADVLDRYTRAQAFGENRSLPEWAQAQNELGGTNDYDDAIRRDGFVTRAFTRFDQASKGEGPYGNELTAYPGQALGGVLGTAGSLFGVGKEARALGPGIAKTTALALPAMLTGGMALPAEIAGAAATGGLMGADTYAGTGSVKAATIAGATGALLPGVSKVTGELGALAFGGRRVAGELAQGEGFLNAGILPKTAADAGKVALGRFVGSQVGQNALNLGSTYAQDKTLDQPFSWKDYAVSQIPWTAFDAVHAAVAKGPTVESVAPLLKPKVVAEEQPFVPAEGSDEAQAKVQVFLDALQNPQADPTQSVAGAIAAVNGETQKVVEATPAQNDEPVLLQGNGVVHENGTHRFLISGTSHPEDEDLKVGNTVFINGKPDVEVDPETGRERIQTTRSQVKGGVHFPLKPEEFQQRSMYDSQQPELPTQEGVRDFVRPPATEEGTAVGEGQGDAFANMAFRKALVDRKFPQVEQRGLQEMGVSPQELAKVVTAVPKTEDPVLSMIRGRMLQDEKGNVVRVGGTDLGEKGVMDERRFLKRTQMSKEMLPALKEAYPEAFVGGKVDMTKLVKGLKERPMVEVKKLYGNAKANDALLAQVEHQLDTEFPGWAHTLREDATGRLSELLEQRHDIETRLAQDESGEGENELGSISKYSFIAPKPESEMPGYVEGLVRVPTTGKRQGNYDLESVQKEHGVKYSGPHFGSEDTNVLAFFRGFEDKGENFRPLEKPIVELQPADKVFHGVEVQSDWGQEVRRHEEKIKIEQRAPAELSDAKFYQKEHDKLQHPLLSSYETLALQAEINHARSVGSKWIFLPDAETVMMTEGHDTAAKWVPNEHVKPVKITEPKPFDWKTALPEGWSWIDKQDNIAKDTKGKAFLVSSHDSRAGAPKNRNEIHSPGSGLWLAESYAIPVEKKVTQEQGMDLHYNTTLPNAMAKLTGDKGVRVEGGVHVKGMGVRPGELRDDGTGGLVESKIGSPVFRNPDGTPKTQITGKLYSLAKIEGGLAQDPTLSLKEAVAKYEEAKTREVNARAKIANVPTSAPEWVEATPDVARAKAVAERTLGNSTQKAEAARLEQQSKEVDSAVQEQNIQQAEAQQVVHRVNENLTGGENLSRGRSLLNEEGKRDYYDSESKAEEALHEYKVSHPEDKTNWETTSRGSIGEGTDRWFIAERPGSAQTSLDAEHGDEGRNLHDVVGEETQTQATLDAEEHQMPSVSPEDRPEPSRDAFRDQLEKAYNSPRAFEQATKVPFEDVQKAKIVYEMFDKKTMDLSSINKEIERNGLEPFEDMGDMQDAMRKVADGVSKFTNRFRSPDLGSDVPFDPQLKEELFGQGRRDAAHLISWVVKQKLPVISDWMRSFLNHPDLLAQLQIVIKGDQRFIGGNGSFYLGEKGGGLLNIARFPAKGEEVEYAHFLTHEITHHMDAGVKFRTDPAAMEYKETRTKLLQRLRESKSVPKNIRDAVKTAVKEDWYGKFVSDVNEDIFPKLVTLIGQKQAVRDFRTFYGLLNEDEMVAQAFSDHRFLRLMDETKATDAPKGGFVQSVLNAFSEGFNKLVGGRDGSALSVLLKSFDNFLTSGSLRGTYNGRDYIRDVLFNQGVRPEELASRMHTTERVFNKGELLPSISGFVNAGEHGILPATMQQQYSTLDQPLRTSLVSGSVADVTRSTMNLLAENLPVHEDLLLRMRQDIEVAKGLYKGVKEGSIPGSLPTGAEKSLALSERKVEALGDAIRRQKNAIDMLNEMDGLTPDGWKLQVAGRLGQLVRSPERSPNAGEAKEMTGKGPLDWAMKSFALMQHLAGAFPGAKAGIERVFEMQGLSFARQKRSNAALVFDSKTGEFSQERVASVKKVATNDQLIKAYSDIKLYQNKEGKMQDLDPNDPYVKQVMGRLSTSGQRAVTHMLEGERNRAVDRVQINLPDVLGSVNRDNTAALMVKLSPTMLPDQGRDFATQLYSALAKSVDPQYAVVGNQELAALAQKISPEAFLASLQHAQSLSQTTAGFLKWVQENVGYSAEKRYGDYKIFMVGPDGKKFADSGTKAYVQKIREQKEKQGFTRTDYITPEDNRGGNFGLTDDYISQLDALDMKNENTLRQLLGTNPLLNEILPLVQRAGDIRASLAQASDPMIPNKRSFVAGRENLNMLQNANEFYKRENNWMRNKQLRAAMALDMLHPDVAQNPELRNFLAQHLERFTTPDNPIARRMTEAVFAARLGMNFGANMVEFLQHLTGGMSALIGETGGVTDAIGLVASSTKNFWQRAVTGKYSNPEHEALHQFLENHGYAGLVDYRDFTDSNVTAMMQANGPVGRVGSTIMHGVRKWSSVFSRYNDNVIAVAAYDLARGKGMSVDDSYKFAVTTKNIGNHSGGKAQRSAFPWNIKTKAVPQLLASLQSYTLGWWGQMGMNWKRGFGSVEGLTETQRLGAKKAFLYQLGAQAVLAGALGLPGVGQGLALFNQVTGVDLKGAVRGKLAGLFDEDQELGGVLSSLALHGVGAVGLPFDPSSRMSIQIPFIGVDEQKGFSVANLGGAVTSTASDFANGLLAAMKGDAHGVVTAMPNALKRPYQLWLGQGDIRDAKGNLQYKLSTTDQYMMALGLKPAKVQAAQDVADAVHKANEIALRKEEAVSQDLATLWRTSEASVPGSGGPTVLQKFREMQQNDASLTGEKLKRIALAIKAKVQQQSFQTDPRNTLRPDAQVAGLSPNMGLEPTNAARNTLGNRVASSLGVMQSPFHGALQAEHADALQQANPYLTRSEAMKQHTRQGLGLSFPGMLPAYLQ